MKKLLKKLSVMRLEERVLFDAAAAAAAVEAQNQEQLNEDLQQQQQQLQEQLAEEAAVQAQQQAQRQAEDAAAAEETPDSPPTAEPEAKEAVSAGSEVSAAVEAIAADKGVESADGEELLETSSDDVVGETLEGLNGIEVEAEAENSADDAFVVEGEEDTVVDAAPVDPVTALAEGTRHELVIVSDNVKDSKAIIDGLAEGTEVLVLDRESDVLDQINEYLDNSAVKYDAIHVVSHGGDGYILLNSSVIDMESLSADPASWAAIGEHVAADGDILLYGCDVAKSEDGKAFASQIASLTGADVAASIDTVGGTYGWELEYVTAAVSTPVLQVANYDYRLVDRTYTVVSVNDDADDSTVEYNELISESATWEDGDRITVTFSADATIGVDDFSCSFASVTVNDDVTVTIKSGATLTADAVTVNGNGILEINGTLAGTADITVDGTKIVAGTGASFDMTGGSTVTYAKDGGVVVGGTYAGLEITGENVEIKKDVTVTVNSEMTVADSGSVNVKGTIAGTADITVDEKFIFGKDASFDMSGSSTVTYANDEGAVIGGTYAGLSITGENVEIGEKVTVTVNSAMTVTGSGSVEVNGTIAGTVDITVDDKFTFGKTASFEMSNGTTVTYQGATVAGGTYATLKIDADVETIGDIEAREVKLGNGKTFTVKHELDFTGTDFNVTLVDPDGSGTINFSGEEITNIYHRFADTSGLTVKVSGGKLYFSESAADTVDDTLFVTEGDGSLFFDGTFTFTSGTITNKGSLYFLGDSKIADLASENGWENHGAWHVRDVNFGFSGEEESLLIKNYGDLYLDTDDDAAINGITTYTIYHYGKDATARVAPEENAAAPTINVKNYDNEGDLVGYVGGADENVEIDLQRGADGILLTAEEFAHFTVGWGKMKGEATINADVVFGTADTDLTVSGVNTGSIVVMNGITLNLYVDEASFSGYVGVGKGGGTINIIVRDTDGDGKSSVDFTKDVTTAFGWYDYVDGYITDDKELQTWQTKETVDSDGRGLQSRHNVTDYTGTINVTTIEGGQVNFLGDVVSTGAFNITGNGSVVFGAGYTSNDQRKVAVAAGTFTVGNENDNPEVSFNADVYVSTLFNHKQATNFTINKGAEVSFGGDLHNEVRAWVGGDIGNLPVKKEWKDIAPVYKEENISGDVYFYVVTEPGDKPTYTLHSALLWNKDSAGSYVTFKDGANVTFSSDKTAYNDATYGTAHFIVEKGAIVQFYDIQNIREAPDWGKYSAPDEQSVNEVKYRHSGDHADGRIYSEDCPNMRAYFEINGNVKAHDFLNSSVSSGTYAYTAMARIYGSDNTFTGTVTNESGSGVGNSAVIHIGDGTFANVVSGNTFTVIKNYGELEIAGFTSEIAGNEFGIIHNHYKLNISGSGGSSVTLVNYASGTSMIIGENTGLIFKDAGGYKGIQLEGGTVNLASEIGVGGINTDILVKEGVFQVTAQNIFLGTITNRAGGNSQGVFINAENSEFRKSILNEEGANFNINKYIVMEKDANIVNKGHFTINGVGITLRNMENSGHLSVGARTNFYKLVNEETGVIKFTDTNNSTRGSVFYGFENKNKTAAEVSFTVGDLLFTDGFKNSGSITFDASSAGVRFRNMTDAAGNTTMINDVGGTLTFAGKIGDGEYIDIINNGTLNIAQNVNFGKVQNAQNATVFLQSQSASANFYGTLVNDGVIGGSGQVHFYYNTSGTGVFDMSADSIVQFVGNDEYKRTYVNSEGYLVINGEKVADAYETLYNTPYYKVNGNTGKWMFDGKELVGDYKADAIVTVDSDGFIRIGGERVTVDGNELTLESCKVNVKNPWYNGEKGYWEYNGQQVADGFTSNATVGVNNNGQWVISEEGKTDYTIENSTAHTVRPVYIEGTGWCLNSSEAGSKTIIKAAVGQSEYADVRVVDGKWWIGAVDTGLKVPEGKVILPEIVVVEGEDRAMWSYKGNLTEYEAYSLENGRYTVTQTLYAGKLGSVDTFGKNVELNDNPVHYQSQVLIQTPEFKDNTGNRETLVSGMFNSGNNDLKVSGHSELTLMGGFKDEANTGNKTYTISVVRDAVLNFDMPHVDTAVNTSKVYANLNIYGTIDLADGYNLELHNMTDVFGPNSFGVVNATKASVKYDTDSNLILGGDYGTLTITNNVDSANIYHGLTVRELANYSNSLTINGVTMEVSKSVAGSGKYIVDTGATLKFTAADAQGEGYTVEGNITVNDGAQGLVILGNDARKITVNGQITNNVDASDGSALGVSAEYAVLGDITNRGTFTAGKGVSWKKFVNDGGVLNVNPGEGAGLQWNGSKDNYVSNTGTINLLSGSLTVTDGLFGTDGEIIAKSGTELTLAMTSDAVFNAVTIENNASLIVDNEGKTVTIGKNSGAGGLTLYGSATIQNGTLSLYTYKDAGEGMVEDRVYITVEGGSLVLEGTPQKYGYVYGMIDVVGGSLTDENSRSLKQSEWIVISDVKDKDNDDVVSVDEIRGELANRTEYKFLVRDGATFLIDEALDKDKDVYIKIEADTAETTGTTGVTVEEAGTFKDITIGTGATFTVDNVEVTFAGLFENSGEIKDNGSEAKLTFNGQISGNGTITAGNSGVTYANQADGTAIYSGTYGTLTVNSKVSVGDVTINTALLETGAITFAGTTAGDARVGTAATPGPSVAYSGKAAKVYGGWYTDLTLDKSHTIGSNVTVGSQANAGFLNVTGGADTAPAVLTVEQGVRLEIYGELQSNGSTERNPMQAVSIAAGKDSLIKYHLDGNKTGDIYSGVYSNLEVSGTAGRYINSLAISGVLSGDANIEIANLDDRGGRVDDVKVSYQGNGISRILKGDYDSLTIQNAGTVTIGGAVTVKNRTFISDTKLLSENSDSNVTFKGIVTGNKASFGDADHRFAGTVTYGDENFVKNETNKWSDQEIINGFYTTLNITDGQSESEPVNPLKQVKTQVDALNVTNDAKLQIAIKASLTAGTINNTGKIFVAESASFAFGANSTIGSVSNEGTVTVTGGSFNEVDSTAEKTTAGLVNKNTLVINNGAAMTLAGDSNTAGSVYIVDEGGTLTFKNLNVQTIASVTVNGTVGFSSLESVEPGEFYLTAISGKGEVLQNDGAVVNFTGKSTFAGIWNMNVGSEADNRTQLRVLGDLELANVILSGGAKISVGTPEHANARLTLNSVNDMGNKGGDNFNNYTISADYGTLVFKTQVIGGVSQIQWINGTVQAFEGGTLVYDPEYTKFMNEPGAYWITVDKADFSDFDADHGYKFAVNFTWTQELMDQLNLNAAFDGAFMVLEGFILTVKCDVEFTGNVTNEGTITVADEKLVTFSGNFSAAATSTFNNLGTVNFNGGVNTAAGSSFKNTAGGTVNFNSNNVTIDGAFVNEGSLKLNSAHAVIASLTQKAGTIIVDQYSALHLHTVADDAQSSIVVYGDHEGIFENHQKVNVADSGHGLYFEKIDGVDSEGKPAPLKQTINATISTDTETIEAAVWFSEDYTQLLNVDTVWIIVDSQMEISSGTRGKYRVVEGGSLVVITTDANSRFKVEGGELRFENTEALTISSLVEISKDAALYINAQDLTFGDVVKNQGTIYAAFSVTGTVENAGEYIVEGKNVVIDGSTFVNEGSLTLSNGGRATITNGFKDGSINIGAGTTLTVGQAELNSAVTTAGFLQIAQDLTLSGNLVSHGGFFMGAAGTKTLTFTGETSGTGRFTDLTADYNRASGLDDVVINGSYDGLIFSSFNTVTDGTVTVNGSFVNEGGVEVTSTGELILAGSASGAGDYTNAGLLNFNGTADVDGTVVNAGVLNAQGTAAFANVENTGTFNASGEEVTLTDLDNSGDFNAAGQFVEVDAGTNSGTISVTGNMTAGAGLGLNSSSSGKVIVGEIDTSGAIVSSVGSLKMLGNGLLDGSVVNAGSVEANGDNAQFGANFSNSGELTVNGADASFSGSTNKGTITVIGKGADFSGSTNKGTLVLANGDVTPGNLVNDGVVEIRNYQSSLSLADMTNNGFIDFYVTATLTDDITNGNVRVMDGELTLNMDQVKGSYNIQSGTLVLEALNQEVEVKKAMTVGESGTLRLASDTVFNAALTHDGTLDTADNDLTFKKATAGSGIVSGNESNTVTYGKNALHIYSGDYYNLVIEGEESAIATESEVTVSNELDMKKSSSLAVSGSLRISGSTAGSGTMAGGSGKVIYDGSAEDQTIYAGVYNDLTIGEEAVGDFDIAGGISVKGDAVNESMGNAGLSVTEGEGKEVTYDGTGTQQVMAGEYDKLTLGGSGTKEMEADYFTVNSFTADGGSGSILKVTSASGSAAKWTLDAQQSSFSNTYINNADSTTSIFLDGSNMTGGDNTDSWAVFTAAGGIGDSYPGMTNANFSSLAGYVNSLKADWAGGGRFDMMRRMPVEREPIAVGDMSDLVRLNSFENYDMIDFDSEFRGMTHGIGMLDEEESREVLVDASPADTGDLLALIDGDK